MGCSRYGGELLRLCTGSPQKKAAVGNCGKALPSQRPRPASPQPPWPLKHAPAWVQGDSRLSNLWGGPVNHKPPPLPPTPQIHAVSMRPPSVSPLLSSELPQYPSSPLPADTRAACALIYFPRNGGEPLPSRGHPSFSSESWQRGQAPGKDMRRVSGDCTDACQQHS